MFFKYGVIQVDFEGFVEVSFILEYIQVFGVLENIVVVFIVIEISILQKWILIEYDLFFLYLVNGQYEKVWKLEVD